MTRSSLGLSNASRQITDFLESFAYFADEELAEKAVRLAYHAALPVVVNAELLNLLRVNFFVDPPDDLPYETEAALLLSSLFNEIGEGLYEINPDLRNTLLSGLHAHPRYGPTRVRQVAGLLEQYTESSAAWCRMPELAAAQRLTAVTFLDPPLARQWLAGIAPAAEPPMDREWYVAMHRRIDDQLADLMAPASDRESAPTIGPASDSDSRPRPNPPDIDVTHPVEDVAAGYVQAGRKTETFSDFYRTYSTRLVMYLLYQGAPAHLAAEFTQDAMIAVYQHWGKVEHPRDYVYKFAYRQYRRNIMRTVETPVESVPEPSAALPNHGDLEAWLQRQEVIDIVQALPPRQRQILALTLDGWSAAEVAALLDINTSIVRSNLRHARSAARSYLSDRKKS